MVQRTVLQIGTKGMAGYVLNQPYTFSYVGLSEAKEFGLEVRTSLLESNLPVHKGFLISSMLSSRPFRTGGLKRF